MNRLKEVLDRNKTFIVILFCIAAINAIFLLDSIFLTSIVVYSLAGVALLLLLLIKAELFYFTTIFFIPLSFSIGEGIGPSISFPSELFAVILTLFLFFVSFFRKKIDTEIFKHPLTIIILLDLAWILISSLLGTMPPISLKRFAVKLLYVSIYYFYAYSLFNKIGNIRKVYVLYILGMVLPIISAFIFHTKYNFVIAAAYEMTKPFYNDHTIYGACLAFLMPFIFLFRSESKNTGKYFWTLILIVFFVAVFLSFSRAAWLSLIAILLLYIGTFFKINMRFISITCLLAGLIVFFSYNTLKMNSKQNKAVSNKDVVQQVESMSNISSDASNTERLNRWYCAWQMFLDKPLSGFGPGTYQFKYGPYQIKEMMTRISTYKGDKGNAHSDYLGYLAETGIFGFLIYISLVFSTMQLGLKNIYHSNKRYKSLSMALFLGLTTFFIAGVFNSFIDIDKTMMPVLCAMAALVAIEKKNKETIEIKS